MKKNIVFSFLMIAVLLFSQTTPVYAAGVVGTGTPASCTEAALDTALAGGGAVAFNCGGAATIVITSVKTINADTQIDGGGVITIDGNNATRLFTVTAGDTLSLSNITLRRGDGDGGSGGAIYNNGTLNLTNVTIEDSTATGSTDRGGAIYSATNSVGVTIADSTFRRNTAFDRGGAIAMWGGSLTVSDSAFSQNTTSDSGSVDPDGGAIYFHPGSSNNSISGSTFDRNIAADDGGAILNASPSLTITTSTFDRNEAHGKTSFGAGGAFQQHDPGANATITLSTFSSNQVAMTTRNDHVYGGAIGHYSGVQLTIANSTFTNNSVSKTLLGVGDARGGAIWVRANTTVYNSTFNGNSILENGTGTAYGGSIARTNGTFTVANTIISSGSANGGANNCAGAITDGGNNIDYNGANNCGGGFSNNNPLLGALTGSPAYYPLQLTSPAIDTGSNATCANASVNNDSQNGITRPQDGNGDTIATCDRGSYELADDTVGPTVVYGANTIPANNSTLATGPTQIFVEFSEDVKSGAVAGSAEDLNNYLLVEDGANGIFNTVSCLGGLVADDTQIAVDTAVYDGSDPFVVTLGINGGVALPIGKYRLFVCGTTSIEDLAGNELNDGANDSLLNFNVGSSAGGGAAVADALPSTGFPHGAVTALPAQPDSKVYSNTNMLLEIPSLNVSMPIVGVPMTENGWDVTWLNRSAGYLAGTAFPTWEGNTVLTGHVWDAVNQPGPFVNIKDLSYGDKVQIEAWGLTYTYEVRESRLVLPDRVNTVTQHEDYDWVTLVTCEDYEFMRKNYSFRRMVRAVLVDVR